MKLYYSEVTNESVLSIDRNKAEVILDVPIGKMLLDFIDLDVSNVCELVIDGYMVDPINSMEDALLNRKSSLEVYDKLFNMHPYFSDFEKYFYYELDKDLSWVSLLSKYEDQYNQAIKTFITPPLLEEKKEFVWDPSPFSEPSSSNSKFYDYLSDKELSQLKELFRLEDIKDFPSSEEMIARRGKIIESFTNIHKKATEAFNIVLNPEWEHEELNKISPSRRYCYYQEHYYDGNDTTIFINVHKLPLLIDENLASTLMGKKSKLSKDTITRLKNSEPVLMDFCIGDPLALCMYEIFLLSFSKFHLRKCSNCGKYFVQDKNYEVKYCERVINIKGQTCRDVGANIAYVESMDKDPVKRVYRKAYKRWHSKKQKKDINEEIFRKWCSKALKVVYDYESNTITLEDALKTLDRKNDMTMILEINNELKKEGVKNVKKR